MEEAATYRGVAEDDLRMQVLRLEGQVRALESERAMFHAADEQRRVELEAARAEAADARAAEREWQGRVEEIRRLVDELRARLATAEETRSRAEQERAAVIAALGRRGRRRLAVSDSSA